MHFNSAHIHHGSYEVPTHAHACDEIVFVVEGELCTHVGETALLSAPGMLHLIPTGTRHDQSASGPWRTICILFDGLDCQGARLVDTRGDYQLGRWCNDLVEWYNSLGGDAGNKEAVCDGLLAALLGSVQRTIAQGDIGGATHAATKRALFYLHEHPCEPVTHDELAQVAQVSTRHLTTLFHQRFGIGPIRYQQRLRMEIACRSLRNPYASIAESAALAGYDDVNYFGRLFRKVHGVSPGQWRRNHGG